MTSWKVSCQPPWPNQYFENLCQWSDLMSRRHLCIHQPIIVGGVLLFKEVLSFKTLSRYIGTGKFKKYRSGVKLSFYPKLQRFQLLQEVTKLFLDSYVVLLNPKQCNQQIYDKDVCDLVLRLLLLWIEWLGKKPERDYFAVSNWELFFWKNCTTKSHGKKLL